MLYRRCNLTSHPTTRASCVCIATGTKKPAGKVETKRSNSSVGHGPLRSQVVRFFKVLRMSIRLLVSDQRMSIRLLVSDQPLYLKVVHSQFEAHRAPLAPSCIRSSKHIIHRQPLVYSPFEARRVVWLQIVQRPRVFLGLIRADFRVFPPVFDVRIATYNRTVHVS